MTAKIDSRKRFYAALRPELGALTQANVVGFERFIDEAIRRGSPLHDFAYVLATAWWETGKTMQPVKEAFWLSEDWRARNLRYFPFYGRGYVQLTWEFNYQKASELYGVDFVANPDLALDPEYSIKIIFDGMENGWFTGKKLDDYIDDIDEADDEDLREFANARRIVNGTDRQIEIGDLAIAFEFALKEAGYGDESGSAMDAGVDGGAGPQRDAGAGSKGGAAVAAGVVALFAAIAAGAGDAWQWLTGLFQ